MYKGMCVCVLSARFSMGQCLNSSRRCSRHTCVCKYVCAYLCGLAYAGASTAVGAAAGTPVCDSRCVFCVCVLVLTCEGVFVLQQ